VILQPAVAAYLEGLVPDPDPVLAEMHEHARRDRVPIVEPPTGAFLEWLARAAGTRRVAESGTAIGVSTLHLARGVGDGGTVVSFEVDRARHEAARGYLARAGLADRVDLRLADAREGLRALAGPVDLLFIDGLKEQYGAYLEAGLPHVRPGGLVVADNALMSGAVGAGRGDGHWSDEAVAGMRAFIDGLLGHPELSGTVLPVGDGLAVAVRR
jgi:caffeoyl-CoA O-methyltransferase